MGTKSTFGMGAAQAVPGRETFKGTPNRFNAQHHIRKIITAAQLPENLHRTLSAEITHYWARNTPPTVVIRFAEDFIGAYRKRSSGNE